MYIGREDANCQSWQSQEDSGADLETKDSWMIGIIEN